LIRIQKFQIVDFLSNVGGILGLMVGCSLLSLIEFAYFIGIRSVSDKLAKKKKVSPEQPESSEKAQSKLKSFVLDYLNNSSIHSAPYIANRNWFEK
jgi:Amiloride-sensitive sodium channel